MLRKKTLMNAATANKFVNKADVISAKSEHAKKHLLGMIDVKNNQIPNLTPMKWGKLNQKSFTKIVMAAT